MCLSAILWSLCSKIKNYVLILVMLDVPLGLIPFLRERVKVLMVLILVMLDVPLGFAPANSSGYEVCVLILVMLDVPLGS